MIGKILIGVLFFAVSSSHAQNVFEKQINVGTCSSGSAVIHTSDSGYLIGGSSGNSGFAQRPCIIKLDSQGNTVWAKSISLGSGAPQWSIFSLKESDKGVYFASGIINNRMFVCKFDDQGRILWSLSVKAKIDTLNCAMTVTDDGGCIVAGNLLSSNFPDETYIIRINASGTASWIKHIAVDTAIQGNPVASLINSIVRLDSGNYVLVGNPSPYAFNSGISVIKIRSSGDIVWYKMIADQLIGNSTIKTSDGGFAVCGQTTAISSNVCVVKFDSSGSMKWGEQVDVSANATGYAIEESSNGDLLVAGSIDEQDTERTLFIRVDSVGNLKATTSLNLPSRNSIVLGMDHSLDSGFIFTGTIGNFALPRFSVLVGKFDAHGLGCNMITQKGSLLGIGAASDVTYTLVDDVLTDTINLVASEPLTSSEKKYCSPETVDPAIRETNDFVVFPNPQNVRGLLTVLIDVSIPSGKYTLSLSNIQGGIIKEKKVFLSGMKQMIPLDISEFSSGIYFLELRLSNKIHALRKVKLIKN